MTEDFIGPVKPKRGRPSAYDPDVADAFIDAITEGKTLREIAKLPGQPPRSTMFRWMAEHPEFETSYLKALRWRSFVRADEIIDIVDDASKDWKDEFVEDSETPIRVIDKEHLLRTKMRCDYRLKAMAAEHPRRYGIAPTLLEDVQPKAEQTGANEAPANTVVELPHRMDDQIAAWRKAANED